VAESLEHLIVAMLAVGGFPLERAWALLPKLRQSGLTTPATALALDERELIRRLALSGYDRGPVVTTSLARRIMAAHVATEKGVLATTVRLMREGNVEQAEKTLREVKGVGPTVFRTFVALERQSKRD